MKLARLASLAELAAEDLVEYLYITTTFVALKGKVPEPEDK